MSAQTMENETSIAFSRKTENLSAKWQETFATIKHKVLAADWVFNHKMKIATLWCPEFFFFNYFAVAFQITSCS